MVLTFFKLFTTLWPFIKEWAFGGKTIKQSLKEERSYTILIFSWLFGVPLVFIVVWRIFALAADVSDYRNKIKRLEAECIPPSAIENVVEDMQNVDKYLHCRESEGDCD